MINIVIKNDKLKGDEIMKNIIHRGWIVLLILYFSLVFSFSISINYIMFILSFCLAFITAFFLLRKQNNASITNVYSQIKYTVYNISKKKSCYKFASVSFIVILLGQVLFWLAYYPGGFNLDAYGQWMQAHNDLPLNDWHPFVSTLVIKFVIQIWDNFPFYIFTQLVMFSLSATLIIYEFSKHGLKKYWLCALVLYYSLSPAIALNNICLTKDVQFVVLYNFLFWMLSKVYFSYGKVLSKWYNILFISLMCSMLLLVRHNGLLLILPLFVVMFVLYDRYRKNIVALVLSVLCLIVLIKVPAHNLLDVEPHKNVVGESVGVPMSIMANALVNDTEHIPEDVRCFLNELASDKEWRENYIVGEWDSCKWEFGGAELLEDASISDILRFTLKTAVACPNTTYESIRYNTHLSWSLARSMDYWVPNVHIVDNEYGINENNLKVANKISEFFLDISMIYPISLIFWNVGFQFILILITCVIFKKNIDRQNLMFIVPLFVFNVGTTLLLAGPNYRYFYHNAVLFIPLLFLLFFRTSDKEMCQ